MKRGPVNSSTVVSAGWEDGTMEMEFASGGIYQYEGVPKETFEGFMRAESKGHFFQVGIRACYECVRLHINGCGVPSGKDCLEALVCPCWCHKERKDVSRGKTTKETETSTAKKAGRKAKPPRPPV